MLERLPASDARRSRRPGVVVASAALHAALIALAGTRFAPAEARGRRVRQLVERTFAFQLEAARR